MIATRADVDVCNEALGHIGQAAEVQSINPSDGSAQADRCAVYYHGCVLEALADHDWGFASESAELARLTAVPLGWSFAYATPHAAVTVREVRSSGGSESEPFTIGSIDGSAVILTNATRAWARYTVRPTADRWPQTFASACAYLLASKLAGPSMKDQKGVMIASAMRRSYEAAIAKAAEHDVDQHRVPRSHRVPPWIAARGS